MNARVISIAAATDAENAALRLVMARFSACLAEFGANAPEFKVMDQTSSAPSQPPNIILSSLLSEAVGDDQTTWNETEARIRQRYQPVSKTGPRQYLCTVFRHVPPDAPPSLRLRIRKLNLLAAELSRATGIFVVDVDRSLADVGARAYATDFRLGGLYATEAVAREIAATLLGTGFDAALPREARDKLKAMMADWQPSHAPVVDFSAAFRPSGPDGRSSGQFATKEAQAADFLDQALRGKLQPGEVLGTARKVIKRDGLAGFARLAWQGVRKTIVGKSGSRH